MTRSARQGTTLSAVLTAIVALALVAVLTATAPDLTAPTRSWQHRTIGETGTIRDLTVTVTGARATQVLDVRGEPLTSSGAFVVVAATVTAASDPVYLDRVQVSTRDGRRYDPHGEWQSAQPQTPVQPGFTATGSWVFELPENRLAGAELTVENDSAEFDGYDRGIRIDLGLAPTLMVSRPVRLPEPTVRVAR